MNLERLPEAKIRQLEPLSYSIVHDPREYRDDFHIEFFGDRQVVLADEDGVTITFKTREEAERYCAIRWQTLKRI